MCVPQNSSFIYFDKRNININDKASINFKCLDCKINYASSNWKQYPTLFSFMFIVEIISMINICSKQNLQSIIIWMLYALYS